MKQNKFFSFLSLFLSVIMLIGCLPMGVFAFEGKDDVFPTSYEEDSETTV